MSRTASRGLLDTLFRPSPAWPSSGCCFPDSFAGDHGGTGRTPGRKRETVTGFNISVTQSA